MDNKQFTSRLARRTSLEYKEASSMLKSTIASMVDILRQGDAVAIPSFGTFATEKTDERIETDERSGRRTLFPPVIEVKFTPSSILARRVADVDKSGIEN